MDDCITGLQNKYYIFDNISEKEVYIENLDNIKKLYTIDKNHAFFLKMLPTLIDRFEELENSLKDYYNYALNKDEKYENKYATNKINRINDILMQLHTFFNDNSNRYNYLINNLLSYYKSMIKYRFLNYLYKNYSHFKGISNTKKKKYNSPDQTNQKMEILSYAERQQQYFINDYEKLLFHRLLYPIIATFTDYTEEKINDKCNHLWHHHEKSIYSNEEIISKYDSEENIRAKAYTYKVLSKLNTVSNQISEYFSVTSEIIIAYPNVDISQIFALFLTSTYYLKEYIDECKFHASYGSIYNISRYYVNKYAKEIEHRTNIAREDTFFNYSTDDLYKKIRESFDSDQKTKNDLMKELDNYYPNKLQHYMNSTIIEFQYFEQVIGIEFLDIFIEKCIIKKCPYPQCTTYFITTSKKIKYCEKHRRQHAAHQKKFIKNQTDIAPELMPLYQKYYNCFTKRIERMNQHEKKEASIQLDHWKTAAKELTQKYINMTGYNIALYKNELNKLSKDCGFEPPRSYQK